MKKCGLLGRKLGHSYSPQIHSMLADYEYLLYEKEPEELEAFLKGGKFDGLNVTIPYKKTVIPYCAELSDTARAIGSVNTLVRRDDGSLFGDNTDAFGFEALIRKSGISVAGKKCLVLGTGGASVTVCAVLEALGAREVITISRKGDNNYGNIAKHSDAEIIVNATPVGMFPNNGESVIDLRAFPNCSGVLDVIYNPARTALLLQAEELGIKNACVFGVSQGGMAAMLLAAGHPGLVSRLLIGSASANVTKNEEKPTYNSINSEKISLIMIVLRITKTEKMK